MAFRRTARRSAPIILIVAVAVILRIVAFSPFAIHHPDEALQYLEQAHRLAFGSGLVPWEYRAGMRSWLVPVLLAGPMKFGAAIAPGSLLYMILARALAAMLCFAAVVAAWGLGARISRAHALVAMAVVAVWYESVFFSVHVLTEPLAVAAFLSAAAIAIPGGAPRRLVIGGALLMLAAILRIQYAPAIALFALVAFGLRWRDWGWLAIGGLVTAAASATIDLSMGQWPFVWIWANVEQNVVANKAAEFGEFGIDAYPEMLWLHWQVAIVPILWCAWIGARRYPALAAAAAINLLVHLAIGHKEYRFILLSGQITILLAALGSVDLVERWRAAATGWRPSLPMALTALVIAWSAVSTALALSPTSDPGWRRFEPGYKLAWQARQRRVCGIALLGGDYWAPTGQAYIGATPLYYVRGVDAADEQRQLADSDHAYDAIIGPPGRAIPSAYRRTACGGEGVERFCLAIRDGGCRRDAASDHRLMQRVMLRNDR